MSKKNAKHPMKDLPAATTEDVKGGAMDGINYLVQVTQMKANNANDSASVKKQKR